MEIKKSKKANLENKRGLFFNLGLVLSFSAVFLAFEWSSEDVKVDYFDPVGLAPPEEDWNQIVIPEKEPEPIKIEPPKVLEVLKVIENTEEPTNELNSSDIVSTEDIGDPMVFTEINDEPEPEEDIILDYMRVEIQPEYPGGESALLKFINQNVVYPALAVEEHIQGKVFVSFVVDKSGEVTNVKLARGVHPLLDNAAIEVVKRQERWKPGEQRGKKVKVKYIVPIYFRLQ